MRTEGLEGVMVRGIVLYSHNTKEKIIKIDSHNL